MRRIAYALTIAIGLSLAVCARSIPAPCFHDCHVTSTGYVLIKNSEGFSPFIYKDAVGIPTVGFGHALQPGEDIRTPLMGPDALALLEHDVNERTAILNRILQVPLQSQQFDAISSLIFNVGYSPMHGHFGKYLNAGQYDKTADEFLRWCYAGKEVSRGLLIRRKAERALFLSSSVGSARGH